MNPDISILFSDKPFISKNLKLKELVAKIHNIVHNIHNIVHTFTTFTIHNMLQKKNSQHVINLFLFPQTLI